MIVNITNCLRKKVLENASLPHNEKLLERSAVYMSRITQELMRKGANMMPLNFRERQAVIREYAGQYQRAGKRSKGQVLDQLEKLTGLNRNYAARVLRSIDPKPKKPNLRRSGSGRKRYYDSAVLHDLKYIWAVLDFPAGKRLAPFLPEITAVLEQHGEIELLPEIRSKLYTISAATIDRLLAKERKRLKLKGRSGTKPGSLLKNAIPIKTFADWNDTQPGFIEIDLVGHDGGNTGGDYAQTLTAVDVATGWTETRAVKNKAQKWVHEALRIISSAFPFPIVGIDSDNGAEFINDHFFRYCAENQITFTRSRPYRKNDSCHVEQKNWSVVRKTVGYLRYDREEQIELLNQLYEFLSSYTNFFQPVLKLTKKERHGSKLKKTYDLAQTPYQRALASPEVSEEQKQKLKDKYKMLNPVTLKRNICDLQDQLFHSSLTKSEPMSEPQRRILTYEYISF